MEKTNYQILVDLYKKNPDKFIMIVLRTPGIGNGLSTEEKGDILSKSEEVLSGQAPVLDAETKGLIKQLLDKISKSLNYKIEETVDFLVKELIGR
jgi:hypothetical protein